MPGHCCNQTFGTQKRHQRRQSIELHMSISAIMHVCNPETFTLASTKQQVRLLFTASCGAAWSSSTSCYAAPAERAGQAGYVSRVTGTLQKCTLGRPGSTQRSDICKRQTLANEHMPRSCRRAGRRTWAVKGLTHDKGAARSASAGRLAAPAHTQHAHTYHPTRIILSSRRGRYSASSGTVSTLSSTLMPVSCDARTECWKAARAAGGRRAGRGVTHRRSRCRRSPSACARARAAASQAVQGRAGAARTHAGAPRHETTERSCRRPLASRGSRLSARSINCCKPPVGMSRP